ncbi:hypothetical protein BDF14DRAFT_144215 [Spinellus fusiger]|nr:hypothetical protein BDF14DRAFT_144215 [Spinellus fusiger]
MPHNYTIITFNDAITDSPIYRSNTSHYDQQLIHLEKWLTSLSHQLTLYNKKLNELNLQAVTFCEHIVPVDVDTTLIDSQVTLPVLRNFATTIQSTLSLKTSDLERNLIQPVQQFVNTHLEEFKRFRKQHKRILEKYETQQQHYAALSKNKDPSILREEAFRLHEARKAYIHMSGQHAMHMIHLRSLLEHCLVEHFSNALTISTNVAYEKSTTKNINKVLKDWRQWLVENKQTCMYQLQHYEYARKKLQNNYIDQIEPSHDLEYYKDIRMRKILSDYGNNDKTESKWGYLFLKRSTHIEWTCKWVFLHGGYVGFCGFTRNNHTDGVVLEERMPVMLCTMRYATENERRFCFEIKCNNTTYTLNAETLQDMKAWMLALEKNKAILTQKNSMSPRRSSSQISQSDSDSIRSRSPRNMSIKAKSTTEISVPIDIPAIISTVPASPLSSYHAMSPLSEFLNSQNKTSIEKSNLSSTSLVTFSISLAPENIHLSNVVSLSSLLVWVATVSQQKASFLLSNICLPLWGTPWTYLLMNGSILSECNLASSGIHKVLTEKESIWPLKQYKHIKVDIPPIEEYSVDLTVQNNALRHLFGSVSDTEVVIRAGFTCSLRKSPVERSDKLPVVWDTLNIDISGSQSTVAEESSLSSYGLAYTGRLFITQENIWFYSSMLVTCINTIALPLKDIKEVRIANDISTMSLTTASMKATNPVLIIELTDENESPIVFDPVTDSIGAILDIIMFMVSNSKSIKSMDLTSIYRKVEQIMMEKNVQAQENYSGTPTLHESKVEFSETMASAQVKGNTENPSMDLSGSHSAEENGLEDKISLTKENKDNVLEKEQNPQKPLPIPPVDPDALPASIPSPSGPCTCECTDHLDRLESESEFPISAKRLYELMFSDEKNAPPSDGGIWHTKTESMQGHDLRITTWLDDDDKKSTTRVLKYIMPVSNPIVRIKEAEVVETQILLREDDYLRYVVQISTKTEALPYADAFIPRVRYCISWVSSSRCKLTCTMDVLWVKSVMVKSIITRAALKAMGETIKSFVNIIQKEAAYIAEQAAAEREDQMNAYQRAFLPEESGSEEQAAEPKEDSKKTETVVSTTAKPTIPDSTPYKPTEKAKDSLVSDTKATNFKRTSTASTARTHKNSSNSHAYEKKRESVPTAQWQDMSKEDGLTFGWVSKTPMMIMITILCTSLFLWCNWVYSHSSVYISTQSTEANNLKSTIKENASLFSKAVYLKDLESGVLDNSMLPPYTDSDSFQLFLQHKNHNISSFVPYRWFSGKHYSMAMDIDSSRERVAVIRHDLLVTFKILNKVDTQLLENEYMNWLQDNQQKCISPSSKPSNSSHCVNISTQLHLFNN